MRLKGKQIQINKETAFQLIDCGKNNPMYEEMNVLYKEVLKDMHYLLKPEGLLGFAESSELFEEKEYPVTARFAMVLYTLGEEISEYCSELFEKGEYLKGMLADAMADSCLFSMEKEWSESLQEECRKRNFGIAKRMEAPVDFGMDIQKKIWQLLGGEKIGVSMTSGYMLSPVKTICLLFLLTDDICQNNVGHDCSRCTKTDCRLRKVNNL